MDSFKSKEKEEVFSRAVKAGRRTYFFDVKETKNGERYLTITESKKCFNNEDGNFFFEKHKIFLYNEDIEKFLKGLNTTIKFIETGEIPEDDSTEQPTDFDSELDKFKF